MKSAAPRKFFAGSVAELCSQDLQDAGARMTSLDLHVPPSATGGIATIGNFDGVHRGHQLMLSTVADVAKRQSRKAVVVTFDPHPVNVLKPEVSLPRLTTIATRSRLLKQYAADEVVVLPVTPALLNMTPSQFFGEIILKKLKASGLVEGPDFHFGKDRAGDTMVLRSLCDAASLSLTVISAVCDSDQMISSTKIRQLISAGNIAAAQDLLGHRYTLEGRVARGAGRGRTLGFPTANLEGIEVLIPADGVYAGAVSISGQQYAAAISIGPNPTFGEAARKIECHVVGYVGELYDQIVAVDVLAHVRGLRAFDSPDQLVAQIKDDVSRCRTLFDAETEN